MQAADASARPGTTMARFHRLVRKSSLPSVTSPSRDSRALMMTAASVHHQNSLRERVPEHRVFLPEAEEGFGEGASVVRIVQRHRAGGAAYWL